MLIFSEQLTADCFFFFFFLLHHWALAYNQLQGFQAVLLTDLELSVSLSESLLHFPTPCTFPVKRCSRSLQLAGGGASLRLLLSRELCHCPVAYQTLHCHYDEFARLIFCLWWWTFGCIFFFFPGGSLCLQINLDLTFKTKTSFYFWVVLLMSVSILCQFQCYLVSFLI